MANLGSNVNKLEESNIISVLHCLYHFDELKKDIINQVNNNQDSIVNSVINFLKNNQNQSIKEILSNSFNKYDYKNTIFLLFEKLKKNLNKIPNNFYFLNLSNQNEEIQKLNEFIGKISEGTIIDNSFYYIEEFKFYCSDKKKTDYKFKIQPFISVNIDYLIKIKKFSNLFNPEIKKEKCIFCGSTNDKCFVEKKIITIPKILIIVLDGVYDQSIQNHYMINHNNFKYILKCFINNNKIVYFKKDSIFYQYDEKNGEKKVDILDKLYPSILFYKIYNMSKENNNKNSNNMQNINNINNQNNMNFSNITNNNIMLILF